MITDADIKKMKAVFTTKEDLELLTHKFESKFSYKEELRREANTIDKKINVTIREVLDFISETKQDIINLLSKQINDFREEMSEFRNEMRDINRNSQSTLNNHESRISQLEYLNKPI